MRDVPAEMAIKLRSAAETFATVGFEAARVEDLSRATGVPTSTIYYYFAGKQDLLTFLLRDYLDTVAAGVAGAIADTQSLPAPQRLAAVVRAQLRVMADNSSTCQVLLAELGRVGRLPQIAEAVQTAFHRPVEKILAEGVDNQTMRAIDVDTVTAAVYGAVTITGLHYLVRGDPLNAERLADEVLALLIDGLRP